MLVHQLLGGLIFAYNLRLDLSRDNWKGYTKENNSDKGLHH